MVLELAVSLPGREDPLDVSISVDDLTGDETREVIALCEGPEPLASLARGEWSRLAARAILYVRLQAELEARGEQVRFDFADMTLDFGPFEPELMSEQTQRELENSLTMEAAG